MESIGEHIGHSNNGPSGSRLPLRLQQIREAAARREQSAQLRPTLWDEDEEDLEAPVAREPADDEPVARTALFHFDDDLPAPSRPRVVEE